MKNGLSFLFAILTWMSLLIVHPATAQIIGILHTFSETDANGFNSDGAGPNEVTISGNVLYGVTGGGGTNGNGAVFSINTDGTGFTELYNFSAGVGSYPYVITNNEGASPVNLILSGSTLYGTAESGGTNGNGTIFSVNTNGTGFKVLHTFTANGTNSLGFYTNSDGVSLGGSLIISGNTLYGTASSGGTNGNGTIFALNTSGTVFSILHTFTVGSGNSSGVYTNSDGYQPTDLILSGNTLYGTAGYGGPNGSGTVFAININNTGFTNLYSFTAVDPTYYTNNDGLFPNDLILSDNTLYGTAGYGGHNSGGTVFAINTNGMGFTTLHSFAATDPITGTNSDGAYPGRLVLLGNTLYGTAFYGGTYESPSVSNAGGGAVFAINTNGTGFLNLYNFIGDSDGANPSSGLVLSGNTLYGGTFDGTYSGSGTVFSLTTGLVRVPRITLIQSGTNAILLWPTNAAGFNLQYTTNMASSSVWSNLSTLPVVINGNYTLTNSLGGTQRFFRLAAPNAPFGIYMGTFDGNENDGGFATMVLPNGQGVVVVGYDSLVEVGLYGSYFFVPVTGVFTDQTIDGGAASGTFTTNTVSGTFVDYILSSTGTFSGTRKADTGIQQANAGYYSGTFSGYEYGPAYAVLAADGTSYFYTFLNPEYDGGGFGTVDATYNVSATTIGPNAADIAGTLDPTNHIISGTYSYEGTPLGTFFLTRVISP